MLGKWVLTGFYIVVLIRLHSSTVCAWKLWVGFWHRYWGLASLPVSSSVSQFPAYKRCNKIIWVGIRFFVSFSHLFAFYLTCGQRLNHQWSIRKAFSDPGDTSNFHAAGWANPSVPLCIAAKEDCLCRHVCELFNSKYRNNAHRVLSLCIRRVIPLDSHHFKQSPG